MTTKKRVEVELRFLDGDAVVERPRGVFRGGVPDPELTEQFGFNVLPAREHDHGGFGPDLDAQSHSGAFQINLWGTAADYRELGRYLLAIAELDASADPDFHQHHDEVMSADGRTRLDLIVRKVCA
ncbi:MAG: hypothetical protein AVDCRST_MAG40-2986 [uncultured Gemmatimonadaceae bacterium]|uniref:Uncharacterized protein n=1 Tax=uncultured Gemmatimonadaceae bacterium TaxID=246130 RepID=A0A6J4ME01_9BACT|nr:MAG: hypothetical protein AVDCRST_MAG40-2986 [uncultured Gemmatimonadaceae bacterium]